MRGCRATKSARGSRRCSKLLNLSGFEERKVTQLSGGQRQRVALGRALAVDPSSCCSTSRCPISTPRCASSCARDRALQQRLGFTAVHVTHDREEAMTMADRIVVMDAGHDRADRHRPKEVFDRPELAVRRELHGRREHDRSRRSGIAATGARSQVGARRLRAVAGHGAAPVGTGDGLFPRRCRVARRRRTPRLDGAIMLPGRIAQRPIRAALPLRGRDRTTVISP